MTTTTPIKTFGTYRYVPAGAGLHRAGWIVNPTPDVAIRLKRHFPRVAQEKAGGFVVAATDEVARDLEWFIQRYPMKPADLHSELHLLQRAEAHRTLEEELVEVLNGSIEQRPYWLDPALPPREYQLIAAELVHKTGQLLLGDDLGLGKTFSGALVLRDPAAVPAVIVTETHLTNQWQRELAKYFPNLLTHIVTRSTPYDLRQLYTGRGRKRRPLYPRQPDVLITTYTKLSGWAEHLRGNVATVIFDEMQALRHEDTNRYIGATRICDGTRYRVGLTATPVYNYGDEIFNLVDLLKPGLLGTRDEFRREWCAGGDGRHFPVRDPAALGSYLRNAGIFLRRTRAEVGRELPDLLTVEQNCDADPAELEKVVADVAAMARLVMSKTAAPVDRFRAAGEMDWRLRHATGLAKAKFVAAFVRLLLESEERVVLWGWHRDVYDVWMKALADFHPVMYTGSESPAAKDRAKDLFVNGDARVLIMSLRSGAGIDGLQDVCRVGVFGELDWSPKVHDQAIGRLHRDGQEDSVVAYYLVSDEGADPAMAEVLGVKRRQSEPIVDPDRAVFEVAEVSDERRSVLLARDVLRRHGGLAPAAAA